MPRGGSNNSIWIKIPGLSDRLVELWNGGASAGECAVRLGNNITRSAALGRLMRLRQAGVNLRVPEVRPPKPKNPKPRPSRAKPVVIVADPETLEPLRLESGEFITAENAKHPISQCRFPYGDATDSDFKYCGHPVKPGQSFCPSHCTKAFQPKHLQTQVVEAS